MQILPQCHLQNKIIKNKKEVGFISNSGKNIRKELELHLGEKAKNKNLHFFYETNVGAGLPVIKTLRSLISTGDKILKIQGILSGTLSYLFNSFNGKIFFRFYVL